MLGTEPQVVENYVNSGQVKIVFWPVLNHGDPSIYSTVTAECVGQQDPMAFWQVHHMLFQNQADLWSADRDYYVGTAVAIGVDQTTFESCYDDGTGLEQVMALDALRRERGIFSQPTFDIGGAQIAGAQSYDTFAAAFEAALK